MDCPITAGRDVAEGYVAGTLSEAEQDAFEQHIFTCSSSSPTCRCCRGEGRPRRLPARSPAAAVSAAGDDAVAGPGARRGGRRVGGVEGGLGPAPAASTWRWVRRDARFDGGSARPPPRLRRRRPRRFRGWFRAGPARPAPFRAGGADVTARRKHRPAEPSWPAGAGGGAALVPIGCAAKRRRGQLRRGDGHYVAGRTARRRGAEDAVAAQPADPA